jgi:hypothetical protein
MAKKEEYTTEELVDMKVFTIQEAREYVKEKTGMGAGLFRECVKPRLNFRPMAKNLKRKRHSHLVVPKKRVDEVIARMKRKLLD